MKKVASLMVIAVVSLCFVSGVAMARVVVARGPVHRTIVVRPGARPVVVKKIPGRGVIVVKKVWLAKRSVIIAGKPYNYTPWRFIGKVVIISPTDIRLHPHAGAAVVANAPVGKEYAAIEEFDGWYHVRSGGINGWVLKDKVDVSEVKEEVETEETK
jgi:hypothetical protein